MSRSVGNIEFVYHLDHIEYVKDGDPKKPLTMRERKICDEIVESIIRKRDMEKTSFKQAVKVTHQNATRVMSLPCVFTCSKAFNGNLTYGVHCHGEMVVAYETDWIVELSDGSWSIFDDQSWQEIVKEH